MAHAEMVTRASEFVRLRRDWPLAELRDELVYHFPELGRSELDRALREAEQQGEGSTAGSARVRRRERAPYVTARLLAERGFWTLTPGAQVALFEWDDLSGRLELRPDARYGAPGVFEALVMNALVSRWADGARAEPVVEMSAREIADVLGVEWFGGLGERIARALSILKGTTYEYLELRPNGDGETDEFSLLDRVRTHWEGAPSSPKRRLRATFSGVVFEAISNRRMIRPVDIATIRELDKNQELARRLFLLLESAPGHAEGRHDRVERLIDDRLAGTLGTRRALRKLRLDLVRAGKAIEEASDGRYAIEVVPRSKRGLRPGDPRYLMRVLRARA